MESRSKPTIQCLPCYYLLTPPYPPRAHRTRSVSHGMPSASLHGHDVSRRGTQAEIFAHAVPMLMKYFADISAGESPGPDTDPAAAVAAAGGTVVFLTCTKIPPAPWGSLSSPALYRPCTLRVPSS